MRDCVQIAPVDMFQLPADSDFLTRVALNLAKGNLVAVGIPVSLETLTSRQLEKWGFLVTGEDDQVVGFVEHPRTLANLIAGLPPGDMSEFKIYFSIFRFLLTTSTLARIASAIQPELAQIPPGQKIDLSDHVVEPLFASQRAAWRLKQGPHLASSATSIARRLTGKAVGVSVVSAGTGGISEDLGTYEALDAFRLFQEEGLPGWDGIWDAIRHSANITRQE